MRGRLRAAFFLRGETMEPRLIRYSLRAGFYVITSLAILLAANRATSDTEYQVVTVMTCSYILLVVGLYLYHR